MKQLTKLIKALNKLKMNRFTFIIVFTVLMLIAVALGIVVLQARDGKHCKTPLIEVNIPK